MYVLRFRLPISLVVAGESATALNLDVNFEHDRFQVHVRLNIVQPPLETPTAPTDQRFQAICHTVEFDVADDPDNILQGLVTSSDWTNLVAILAQIVNRVFRAIRNVGTVPHISEVRPRSDESEQILRMWDVKVQTSGGSLQQLVPEVEDLFAALLWNIPTGMLRSGFWPDVQDAVRADLRPGPHQEFVTNAIEHAQLGNLRYALLEGIIGLEIVLGGYLQLFLERRGISKRRIEDFLNPNLGLRNRVGVLLNLVLGEEELRGLEIDKVLAAISWRNDVVHKLGQLPPLNEKVLREHIGAVVAFVLFLAGKYENLKAAPDLQRITQQLVKEYGAGFGGMFPSLQLGLNHYVHVSIGYIARGSIPDEAGMRAIITRVEELLAERDSQFDAVRHMRISFTALADSKLVAEWRRGALVHHRP